VFTLCRDRARQIDVATVKAVALQHKQQRDVKKAARTASAHT
jgi:hypothetical protein